MISSNFNLWILFFLITYIYIEYFFSICYNLIFKNLKDLNQKMTKNNNFIFFKTNLISLVINLLILYFIFFKSSLFNIFFSLLLLILVIIKFINKFLKNYNYFLILNIIIFFSLFFFVNNFITFYLYIELYSILFYFFFLNINFNFKNLYFVQYKNSLLLYLFNNFLTSMLYLFGISFIISNLGTLNFNELKFFTNINVSWQLYILILSFVLKMSFPGYHFLKIELYKYLDVSVVILFSVLTLYINYLFSIFFFNQNIIFLIINNYKFLTLLLLSSIFFLINKLKISNFQEFISFSGFATNNLIILNFII